MGGEFGLQQKEKPRHISSRIAHYFGSRSEIATAPIKGDGGRQGGLQSLPGCNPVLLKAPPGTPGDSRPQGDKSTPGQH